jgi:hypothetical protein
MRGKHWTPAEDKTLLTLYGRDVAWSIITAHLPGRTEKACTSRLDEIGNRGRARGAYVTARIPISDDLEGDRLARLGARSTRDEFELYRGNVTPAFFGAPPPGYSALDRKRAGV